jgi:GNAT superfamily N-acetyltransferase
MSITKWFERKFPAQEDNGALHAIIERLSAAPARAEEITGNTNASVLEIKPHGKWSIKEHIGHLGDLEPLWLGRMDDFENHLAELRPADLTNEKTHTANHNAKDVKFLLQQFREQRMQLVSRFKNLSNAQLTFYSMHPRLKTPMRIIDHAYFVAEHDGHHLAFILEIIQSHALTVKRTTGNDADLKELVMQLDKFLWSVYKQGMEYFGQFNYVDEDHRAIVIYSNRKPVGCGCLREIDAKTTEIKRMFVLPQERNKGIAGLVLHELEKWAKELGYKKVILETGDRLTAAIHLYQKHQYKITENYGPYVGIKDSVCMEKMIV